MKVKKLPVAVSDRWEKPKKKYISKTICKALGWLSRFASYYVQFLIFNL